MKDTKTVREPTIRDVASKAGVAVGTVSRFLNGHRVRSTNRQRIEQAIRELSYKTNTLARSMKTRKTHTVGVIVSGYDQFNSQVLAVIVKRFHSEEFTVVTYHHEDDPEILQEVFESFSSRFYDGIALSGLMSRTEELNRYSSSGRAVVLFNNDIEGIEVDRVFVNDEESSYRATEYLIQMNHEHIGLIAGNLNHSTARNRLNGYRRALRNHSISESKEFIVDGQWKTTGGYHATKRLLQSSVSPTAILVSNHLMTIGFLQALNELSLRIPKDISLISFDDIDMFQVFNPPISAIAQPAEQIGDNVFELMLERIQGRYSGNARLILLPCQLVLRNSVSKLE
jgi:DNA-binding LacI/PurR family transcriptional regulator